MNLKLTITSILVVLLSSCTNIIRTSEDSEVVRLYFLKNVIDNSVITDFEKDCRHIGEVIGSEGHWYTYLFISNTNLTQGALNDMKNNAHATGANAVIVYDYISSFKTSVTFLGQAYRCTTPPVVNRKSI